MRSRASLAISEPMAAWNVEELAADVPPAGGFGDRVAGEQLVEPGIAANEQTGPAMNEPPWRAKLARLARPRKIRPRD